ncbi:MAG TPA: carboxypeptidase regulatory-like domain-containing protein [Terriglobales bacterium]
MRLKLLLTFCVPLLGFCVLTACNSQKSIDQSPTAALSGPPAAPIDPATVASVSGTVHFDGTAPEAVPIDMSNDPACKGDNKAETVVVNGGKLANVFVYVKDGLGTFPAPANAVVIDQTGCRYRPHVAGVMVGQKLDIRNDDPTEHNVHAIGMQNAQWNESQMPKAAPIEKSFDHPEIMLPIKCNQHPWMKMYVNVVANPFYAVTDANGKFEIAGLPPGDYTIAFVQEKMGEQDQKITLGAKDKKTLDISYKAQ